MSFNHNRVTYAGNCFPLLHAAGTHQRPCAYTEQTFIPAGFKPLDQVAAGNYRRAAAAAASRVDILPAAVN
jgi:hypothetical protein